MPRGIFERYANYALDVDRLYQPMIQQSTQAMGQVAGQSSDRISRLLDQRSRLATEQVRRKELAQRVQMVQSEAGLRQTLAQTKLMELEVKRQQKDIAAAKEEREANPSWVHWKQRGTKPVRIKGKWSEPTVTSGNNISWREIEDPARIKSLDEAERQDPMQTRRRMDPLDAEDRAALNRSRDISSLAKLLDARYPEVLGQRNIPPEVEKKLGKLFDGVVEALSGGDSKNGTKPYWGGDDEAAPPGMTDSEKAHLKMLVEHGVRRDVAIRNILERRK